MNLKGNVQESDLKGFGIESTDERSCRCEFAESTRRYLLTTSIKTAS